MGSVAAQARSIASRNDTLSLPVAMQDLPVFVTKDDAREAQSLESTVYGGQNPRGGMAAQMQVRSVPNLFIYLISFFFFFCLRLFNLSTRA